jgi:hypothetical protein
MSAAGVVETVVEDEVSPIAGLVFSFIKGITLESVLVL